MGSKHFLDTRSVKLLFLFFLAIVLLSGFLSAVFHTLESDRKLPPHTAVIHDRALRGAIVSKEGYTLSRSNKTYEATVHARSIDPDKKELFIRLFAIYSGMGEQEVRAAFMDKKGRPKKGFVTLSKTLDAATAIQLKHLAYQLRRMHVFRSFVTSRGVATLYGLDILENGEEREFQLGDTLTPALGYVRSRNVGRYRKIYGVKGLEKRYDKYLNKSRDGLVRGMRDVLGTIIRNKSSIRIPRRDGYSLHLNIPLDLQKYVETTLDRMKKETGAKEIVAAVMESRTGKILALASSERYDPAHITQEDIPKLNAKCSEYPYEPGSVIKPITLAIALDHGKVTPDTWFKTYNGGPFFIGKRQKIHDDEPFDSLTATDIIVHSSNIGISQIAWRLSGKEFHDGLSAFGLGRRSGIDLSRELPGKIKPARLLERKPHEANQAYGYGMQATFIQLLKAHNVFNNDGVIVTPRIGDFLEDSQGHRFRLDPRRFPSRRIIRSQTARQMHTILQKVVREGTGVAAQYPGLDVGGKTGTAHIAEHGHYVKRYNSSFYGFANDDKGHRYEIGVLVIEASKYHKYFASKSAVPTFKAIVDDLVELGYLHPNLTPEQRAERLAKEKKRREAARKIQQERTRRIKELLRRQREQMHRRKRKTTPRPRSHPSRPVHRSPRYQPPIPKRRPTPHEALPDMF